jgi:drug/metabolite transporter (DMT)-like permease
MRGRDIARMLMLGALWGGSFAFMRVAVPALGPIWLAACRVTLAFAALLALASIRGDVPALRAHWRGYLVVGVLNSAVPFALFSFAAQYISASTSAVLNATSPFFGALVAAVWLGERLTARKLVGMLLGFCGVALLVGWRSAAPGQTSGEAMTALEELGVLACLVAALCYALAGAYIKLRLNMVPSSAVALYSQLSAAVVLVSVLPLAPLPLAITPVVAFSVLALALLSTAVAYLLYFRLIADLGPARALTVTFLIPLFGALWGLLFLHEALTPNTLVGGALILSGTWFAGRAPAGRSVSTR